MTTLRQIRQVFKQITARHADTLVLAGPYLWIRPVHHVARRIFIDRTSHPDYAAPQWNIQETFLPGKNLVYGHSHYGFQYFRDPPGKNPLSALSWQWSDPTMLPHLVATLENVALPFLRSLDNLDKYAACYRGFFDKAWMEYPEDRMIMDVALGDLDTARVSCLKLLPKYRQNMNPDCAHDQLLRTRVVTVAEPLMAGDRKALAAILHGWEAANIRGTMLEPHWEPTPFPLEA